MNSGIQSGENSAADDNSELVSLLRGEIVPMAWLAAAGIAEAALEEMIADGRLEMVEEPGHVLVAASGKSGVGRHREFHARLADAARRLRMPPEFVARHFEAAQQLRPARDAWVAAAEKAVGHGDHHAALGFIRRALAIWPWTERPGDRLIVLKQQARYASNAGDVSAAAAAWEEIAGFAKDEANPELQAAALRQLAGCVNDPARVGEYLEMAASIAVSGLAPHLAVPFLLARIDYLAGRMRIAAARDVLMQAEVLARASGEPALISEVLGWRGLLAAMAGRHDEAREQVLESLRLALDHDLKEQAALAYRRQANISEYAGDYRGERDHHHEAIRYCRSRKVDGETVCMSCLAYVCFRTGDWKEAISTARRVISSGGNHPALDAISRAVTGWIAAFRGERRIALRLLDAASQRLRIDGIAGLEFFCLWARAWLHQIDGEIDDATRCYDEVRAIWRESEDVHDVLPALMFAGAHYADQGLGPRLNDCLDIANSVFTRNPISEARAVKSALLAEASDGNPDLFQQAAREFAKAGLPLERIWIECRLLRHHPSLAADSSVLADAARLGVRPMLAQLRSPSGPAACDLTGRQIDVLRGLSTGLTSKEIASRLGLSVRTVDMHVARLMRRLDCRTRSEAVRIATHRGWI